MQVVSIDATASGSTGSASGSATAGIFYAGELHAVYIDYGASMTATNTVRIKTVSPALTLLTVSSNATDGWFFPRNALSTNAGATVASTSASYPITSKLQLAISTAAPQPVTVHCFIKEQ